MKRNKKYICIILITRYILFFMIFFGMHVTSAQNLSLKEKTLIRKICDSVKNPTHLKTMDFQESYEFLLKHKQQVENTKNLSFKKDYILTAIALSRLNYDFESGMQFGHYLLDSIPNITTKERIIALSIIEETLMLSFNFEDWYFYYKQVHKLESAIGVYQPIRYYAVASNYYYKVNDYETARYYYLQFIKEKKKSTIVDYVTISSFYNNIGLSYYYEQKYDSALYSYNKGLSLLDSIHHFPDLKMKIEKLIEGNMARVFMLNNRDNKAVKEILTRNLEYYSNNDSYPENIYMFIVASKFYLKEQNYKKAKDILDRAEARINKENPTPKDLMIILFKGRKEYHQALGDHKKALEYAELSRKVANEHQKQLNKQVKELNFGDIDDKKLKILQHAYELAQKEEANKKNTRILSFFLLLIVILSVFILLVYKLYLEKKSSSKEILEKQTIIEKRLREKKVLLNELNTRVHSNLYVISNIIKKQISELGDEEMSEHLNQGLNRIKSISMVHKQLNKKSKGSNVVFKSYIHSLVNHLKGSFTSLAKDIEFKIDVEDAVEFSVDLIVPLGLIVNELITNSLKHAFTNCKSGKIEITLRQLTTHSFTLLIADNGKGMEDRQIEVLNLSGLKLVEALAMQINGDLGYDFSNGTRISIHFFVKD